VVRSDDFERLVSNSEAMRLLANIAITLTKKCLDDSVFPA
jgi:hypothetical protein